MTRSMALTAVLMGLGGFAIGWIAIGARTGADSEREHTVWKPPAAAVPDERREFPLLPADVHADRETPAVAVDGEGRVVLAWASQTAENERTLMLARSGDGGKTFEAPLPWRKVPIYHYTAPAKGDRPPMAFSTHVLPRLVSGREGIDLGWVEAIDGGPKVLFYTARTRDGGKSFSEPVPVHGGEAVKPGFTTLWADPEGNLVAAWLDGRNKAPLPFAAVRPAGAASFEPERLVYPGPAAGKGVCPCCDMAALRTGDGRQVVAFRNNDSGHRDIWIARSLAGGASFEPPAPVSPDAWSFDGCPHDAPALSLSGDRLHVLWMDAHTGKNRVYAASTSLASWSFTPKPLTKDAAGAQGHPKLLAAGGRLIAVWDEALDEAEVGKAAEHGHGHGPSLTGSGRAVMVAVSTDDGAHFGQGRAVAPRPGAFQLNPALAVAADGTVLVAWNELDVAGKRVVFARLPTAEEPSAIGTVYE